MRSDEKVEFLGKLYMQLERSERAYKRYMSDGQKFLDAKIIKRCNESIRSILLSEGHILSDDLRNDAMALVEHIDVWMEIWIDSSARLQPSFDDKFAFENTVVFPKAAASNLQREFLELRKSAAFGEDA